MSNEMKLLEQSVARAVDRLRSLSEERQRLAEELRALERRLADLEGPENVAGPERPEQDAFRRASHEDVWPLSRAAMLTELRGAVADLRGS